MCSDICFHSSSRPMHVPTLKTSEPSRYASVTCSFMGFALNSLLREPRFFLFGKPLDKENSGAESVCNKLYSSRVPLNLFVRKLSMWSSLTGIRLECSHIAGEKNFMLTHCRAGTALNPFQLDFTHRTASKFHCRSFGTYNFRYSSFRVTNICCGHFQLPTCWVRQ